MALKWEDELYETECTGLDVAVTRTGMVSLTATFKPVEIDGTMVSRAYVHNFTIYKNGITRTRAHSITVNRIATM